MVDAEAIATDGHPIVFAEHFVDEAYPTILVYGHYDAQPPDPLALWESPPFEPVIKNGMLYARGTCDDKGKLFMHLKALESYFQTTGQPPVNLKFIYEGEEESGSKQLVPFIKAHKDQLAADVVLISDTAIFAPGVPSITYGLRGMAYVEVILTGPDRDLHSGVYGGAIENPLNVLARLIAGLHDADYRITLPGFYDDVHPLTDEERESFRQLPFDEHEWMASVGVEAVYAEKGYTVWEAVTARPTFDANGIWGGYTGSGAKTVIPARASAKLSCRLVPGQDPQKVYDGIVKFMNERTPPDGRWEISQPHGGSPAVRVPTTSPFLEATMRGLDATFGRKPVLMGCGGSIPVVGSVQRILGFDSLLVGFGLDDDRLHSPNEKFELRCFEMGIKSHAAIMSQLASVSHSRTAPTEAAVR